MKTPKNRQQPTSLATGTAADKVAIKKARLARSGKLLALAGVLLGASFSFSGTDTVKAAACAVPTTDLGTDTLTVNVPADGAYTIWTRMTAADATNNSINLEVDSNECYDVGGGTFAATAWADDSSNWVNYASGNTAAPIAVSMTAGSHTLKYVGTKTGVTVDKVLLLSDSGCTPSGTGDNCVDSGTGLTAPTGLHTSIVTSSSVALAWDVSNSSTVTGYVIYRDGNQIGESTAASYTDSTVSPNTQYAYTVAAKDSTGQLSSQSAVLNVNTVEGGGGETGPRMYLNPASGNYTVGSNFTVDVHVDTATTAINTAQADLTYSSNLEFVGIDLTGSGYAGGCPIKSGGSGTVQLVCLPALDGATVGLSGDNIMGKVTFKVLAAGTGTVGVQSTSQAMDATESTDVLTGRVGGSYNLANATPTPPTPTPPAPTPPAPAPTPPAPAPSPTPVFRPTTPSTGGGGTTSTTTTITPQGSSTPVTLPDDSTVELSDPVTVQTVPDASKTVTKVEYYLNGKLIYTAKTAPFSYSVKTDNMKNGTYTLLTKTYYDDGTTENKTQSLVVKNPMSFKQLMLQLGGLIWIILLLLIAAAVAVWYIFFFRKNNGDDDGYGDDGYTFGPIGGDPNGGGDPNAGGGGMYGPPTGQPGAYSVLGDASAFFGRQLATAPVFNIPAGRY